MFSRTYGFILTVKDLSPNIGVLWYFFDEVSFDISSVEKKISQAVEVDAHVTGPFRFTKEASQFRIFILFSDTQISLVVVDEAHCVSEWSHNFRPSYMRLKASMLIDKLEDKCILAMTTTTTSKELHYVMHALDIPKANLIQTTKPRDNWQLSVSLSGNRMKDLMTLMKSSPFLEAKSIIINCKFQSYHSAIFAKDRRRTQGLFCANKIRVVVATVAFGMGLNKMDVDAVRIDLRASM